MKRFLQLTLIILALLMVAGVAGAQEGDEADDGRVYIVQPGDGLIKLARLFYGSDAAHELILKATNALAASDSSYRAITDANIILVGQKLWLPAGAMLPAAEEMAAGEETAAGEGEATLEESEMSSESDTTPVVVPLAGTSWLLSTLDGQAPLAGTTITLEFADEENAAGTSGCNGFGASYEADGFHISFGPTVGTLRACEEPVMAQEQAFLQVLADAAFYEVSASSLRLFDAQRTLLAEFVPASSELAGSSWDVINYNNGRQAVVSVMAGTQLTAVFGEDGQISGSAGCNNYFGPYTTEGRNIEIGPLAATLRLCIEEELMAQEAEFLAALESAATFKITGDMLEMRTADDAMAVNFTRAAAVQE